MVYDHMFITAWIFCKWSQAYAYYKSMDKYKYNGGSWGAFHTVLPKAVQGIIWLDMGYCKVNYVNLYSNGCLY